MTRSASPRAAGDANQAGKEIGRQGAVPKPAVGREGRQKGDVVLHSADVKAVEGDAQAVDRRPAISAGGDELGDHRIVMEADLRGVAQLARARLLRRSKSAIRNRRSVSGAAVVARLRLDNRSR